MLHHVDLCFMYLVSEIPFHAQANGTSGAAILCRAMPHSGMAIASEDIVHSPHIHPQSGMMPMISSEEHEEQERQQLEQSVQHCNSCTSQQ